MLEPARRHMQYTTPGTCPKVPNQCVDGSLCAAAHHDGSPVPLAGVVAGDCVAVMQQAECVPDLMGSCVSNVLGPVGTQQRRPNEGGVVGAEAAHPGHAARGAAVPVVGAAADDGADAAVGECSVAGVLRGDVDVERGVVLSHGAPDVAYVLQLSLAERGGVVVLVVRLGLDGGAARGVPPGVLHGVAVKVEHDGFGRARPAVQAEDLVAGERRGGSALCDCCSCGGGGVVSGVVQVYHALAAEHESVTHGVDVLPQHNAAAE